MGDDVGFGVGGAELADRDGGCASRGTNRNAASRRIGPFPGDVARAAIGRTSISSQRQRRPTSRTVNRKGVSASTTSSTSVTTTTIDDAIQAPFFFRSRSSKMPVIAAGPWRVLWSNRPIARTSTGSTQPDARPTSASRSNSWSFNSGLLSAHGRADDVGKSARRRSCGPSRRSAHPSRRQQRVTP